MTKIFFLSKFLILLIMISLNSIFITKIAYGIEPEEVLDNPDHELRARNISKNIRCLVCQNQSIDESSAMLAKDLRVLIRKKISEDFTDKEIYNFLSERYGDFILLKPPLNKNTYVLWGLPFFLFTFGIFILYFHNKKSLEK